MNIIVKPYNSDFCYCRPDTTWEKESRDLYVPEGVDKLLWAPVIFARVSKAGKCVSHKFVGRYYDAVGFGALAYSNEDNIALSSCLDHTSLLPMPLYNPAVLENEENTFGVIIGEQNIAFQVSKSMQESIEQAICMVSKRVSLRIGDMVALEIAPLQIAAERKEGEVKMKAEFCENTLFDLKVIF